MKSFEAKNLSIPEIHKYLLGAISPRPIAFVSTVDKEGQVNLSPFSFFNVFSANPPILIFSPARRGRDGSTKHTLENLWTHPEAVVNIVSYKMVQQMSLASTEYAKGINEFVKAGFTPLKSEKVSPPRVAESPAQFECKVNEIIPLGTKGGAGNLVIAEVLMLHLQADIFGENGLIDPQKLDAVGRLGGDWYCRTSGQATFEVEKPLRTLGIGVDQIPEAIRKSKILSGNDLGILGNVEQLPTEDAIGEMRKTPEIAAIYNNPHTEAERQAQLHRQAKQKIEAQKVMEAWAILLQKK